MADDNTTDDDTTKLPPLENWSSQTFAYGFLIDRTGAADYTGNPAVTQSTIGGIGTDPDTIHLLNLNPESLSYSEPIATAVDTGQGGGKVVESRGGVLKSISISGNTGLLPPKSPHANHFKALPSSTSISSLTGDANLIDVTQSTGFFEFYRLRQLFRRFMKDRKAGKVCSMHWLDFKANEFWLIEPKRFMLDRNAGSTRFTYRYNIEFDLMEPSTSAMSMDLGSGFITSNTKDVMALLRNPLSNIFDRPTVGALTRLTQLVGVGTTFLTNFALGTVTTLVQSLLNDIGLLQSFVAEGSSLYQTANDTFLSLCKQAYSSLQGINDTFSSAFPDAYKNDWNEWLLETQFYLEGLIDHQLTVNGTKPGQAMVDANNNYVQQRASQGTSDQFMQETSPTNGSPTVNPFVGSSGLNLLGDLQKAANTTTFKSAYVLTGDNIWDIAQRCLGDANRFIDLVVFNQLKAPYIVSDIANKPSGTLAWGETIYVPTSEDSSIQSYAQPISTPVNAFADAATVTLTGDFLDIQTDTSEVPWRDDMWNGFTVEMTSGVQLGQKRIIVENTDDTLTVNRAFTTAIQAGDSFKVYLELFSIKTPLTPDTIAFGRDILAVFQQENGLILDGSVDCLMSPLGDLSTVQGLDNFEQAITMVLQSERGSDKCNPSYGTVSLVGRRFEPNMVALHIFYVTQSLTADPRVASVEQPTVTYESGALYFSCYVKPIKVQKTLFFRIPL